MVEVNKYSFKRGWTQRRLMDAKAIKREVMDAFGIRSEPSWCVRLNGKIVPKMDEYEKVTSIFKKYGITDVWEAEKFNHEGTQRFFTKEHKGGNVVRNGKIPPFKGAGGCLEDNDFQPRITRIYTNKKKVSKNNLGNLVEILIQTKIIPKEF